jgi:hypothetical protein
MIKEIQDPFFELQTWYNQQCDGDWEHEFGIKIDTLDNPGWFLIIDLIGTDLENETFYEIDKSVSPTDWIQCNVRNNQYQAFGGTMNLREMVNSFVKWKNEIKMNKKF